MVRLRSVCLGLLSLFILGSQTYADIIYVYEGAALTSIDAGTAFVSSDRITGTITFDSPGDLFPDVSFSVTSSGSPSLPFTIAATNVGYGGTWADTNGDGLLDDPFATGYGFALSANRVGGALLEEILVTDFGDSVGIDVDFPVFGHAASNNTAGNLTFVPEPSSGLLLLLVSVICRVRIRKPLAI